MQTHLGHLGRSVASATSPRDPSAGRGWFDVLQPHGEGVVRPLDYALVDIRNRRAGEKNALISLPNWSLDYCHARRYVAALNRMPLAQSRSRTHLSFLLSAHVEEAHPGDRLSLLQRNGRARLMKVHVLLCARVRISICSAAKQSPWN